MKRILLIVTEREFRVFKRAKRRASIEANESLSWKALFLNLSLSKVAE